MFTAQTSQAGSGTWKLNPTSGDWNTVINWTPATVPNGSADTATFASSNQTAVSLSANTEVDRIVFNPGASAFTITPSPTFALTLSGAGIANNSGVMQNFVADVDGSGNAGLITFTDSATAGALTRFTNNGATLAFAPGGQTQFLGTASAGNGTFITNGGRADRARGGATNFYHGSSAESGNFTTNGGAVSGAYRGNLVFNDNSTASNGIFINSGGITSFYQFASAGAGTFTINAGWVAFFDNSTASNGIFANKGGVISGHYGGGMEFSFSATAGRGTFTNDGGTVNYALGASIYFGLNSTAGNGVFTNNGGGATNGGGGQISFAQTASAGSAIVTNNGGGVASGAQGASTYFSGDSTAGNGTFTNNGGANGGGTVFGVQGALTSFSERASAGNGTFTNNGSMFGPAGAVTRFLDTSTASNGTFINNSGASPGTTRFANAATAGSATLIANGGSGGANGGYIRLDADSTGGTARVEVFGNGRLDLSAHNAPGVTIGSLEGTGFVLLGARNLTVGSSDLSTTFSGVVRDGGAFSGTGGSLTKIGTGTLSLSGANIYTGPTMITGGRLLANNISGLGTGTAAVTVSNSGSVLGGTGTIGGSVTVNPGAALLGGDATTPSGSMKVANDLALETGSIIELTLGASGTHSTLSRTGGTWTFASNQAFTFIGNPEIGVYDNIITGLAANPGGVGSWTITNAGIAGAFTYDEAGNIDLNVTAVPASPFQLTAAVSRKTHGAAGIFDVPLPLTGAPGVECRSSGGNHTLIFTFNNHVVSGTVNVSSSAGSVTGAPTFSGPTMTVNLTGVADVQQLTVILSYVMDSFSQILPDSAVSVNMLIGDTNGNKTVNASDIGQTKGQAGVPVTDANFRQDVTVSGTIDASDIGLVKSRSGSGIPIISSVAETPALSSGNITRQWNGR